ncbi:uncharacterized protein LOC135192452 isoform X2 [Pogoniulus pusillus]|uniref:uncharacterized protein LOC135192452 isoform X2 n=1 Tax=Pogoniulus pusillus TaxID=488313 RepID=UPI0030B99164
MPSGRGHAGSRSRYLPPRVAAGSRGRERTGRGRTLRYRHRQRHRQRHRHRAGMESKPPPGGTVAGLAQCQGQLEEVAALMRQNLGRALEREGHLAELEGRAQELHVMSRSFTRRAQAVAGQQRRAHRRHRALLFGLAAAFLLLLLLILALALWLARPAPALADATPRTTPGGH